MRMTIRQGKTPAQTTEALPARRARQGSGSAPPVANPERGACACGGDCPRCREKAARSVTSERAAVASAAGQELERTAMSSVESGNQIDFTFDPTTTSPKPTCSRIPIVQTIRMTADGSAILPGTYYSPWTCRDPIALGDATYIDSSPGCPCSSPYYTTCGNGTEGSSNGTTRNATCMDGPLTAGGDRGFRSATNPTGWNTVVFKFEIHAFCGGGTQCGTWYDGIGWEYRKTAAEHAAGRDGTSTASRSINSPGRTFIRAFDHFNSVQGFTPCP